MNACSEAEGRDGTGRRSGGLGVWVWARLAGGWSRGSRTKKQNQWWSEWHRCPAPTRPMAAGGRLNCWGTRGRPVLRHLVVQCHGPNHPLPSTDRCPGVVGQLLGYGPIRRNCSMIFFFDKDASKPATAATIAQLRAEPTSPPIPPTSRVQHDARTPASARPRLSSPRHPTSLDVLAVLISGVLTATVFPAIDTGFPLLLLMLVLRPDRALPASASVFLHPHLSRSYWAGCSVPSLH